MRHEVVGIVPGRRQLPTCGDIRERTIGLPPFVEGADRVRRNIRDVSPVPMDPLDALAAWLLISRPLAIGAMDFEPISVAAKLHSVGEPEERPNVIAAGKVEMLKGINPATPIAIVVVPDR